MAQIQNGVCSVTHLSNIVVADPAVDWTQAQAALTGGSPVLFSVMGDIEIPYQVTNFTPPGTSWTLTLATNYQAADQAAVPYIIHTDFTLNRQLPIPSPGDTQMAQLVARAFNILDSADVAESFVYADCVARTAATGFSASDVGRIAFQSDNETYWRLTSVAPLWQLIGTMSNFMPSGPLALTAATRTYIPGSALRVGNLQLGSTFSWDVVINKTAAGTGTTNFDVAIGAAGTTADAARVTFVGATETAAVDAAKIRVTATVRTLSATGIVQSSLVLTNVAGAAAGFKAQAQSIASSAFDNTGDNLYVGLCITAGAADVANLYDCVAQCWGVG